MCTPNGRTCRSPRGTNWCRGLLIQAFLSYSPGTSTRNAGGGTSQTPTYGNLIAAGFVDAWSATNPDDPGYTWPLHLEDPLTASATPVDRIDLVLLLNKIGAKDAELVGNGPADLTPSGLWPSDHAGVVATVRI